MSYTLRINEKQLYVILRSLDLMNRIHMGQVETIYQALINNHSCKHNHKKATEILAKFKEIEFPLLFGPEHYSIASDQVPEEAKVGWDLVRVIRHKLCQEGKAETFNAYADPPNNISAEKLAEITSDMDKRVEQSETMTAEDQKEIDDTKPND